MKTLPKYFAIKQCVSPLWKNYIDWLNKTYKQKWGGDVNSYYGFDGSSYFNGTSGRNIFSNFDNNPVELTLEQWDECVNGKKLTLQDVFIIETGKTLDKCNHMDGDDILSNWDFVQWPFRKNHYWIHFKNLINLPIITYKQFLEMQEKKIIGYKLVKEEYLQAACVITRLSKKTLENLNNLVSNLDNTFTLSLLKEANVLDLWFEPVFKTEEKILELGSPIKTIKVSKEHFECENNKITTNSLKNVLDYMLNTDDSLGPWGITFPSVKIGCSTFTKEEIELLLNTQKGL